MYLTATAEAAAQQLAALGATFTSGHRDLRMQAHDMAVNVSLERNWVGKTYLHGAPVQSWIDVHPDVVTIADLAEGIYQVIAALPPDQQISHHLLMPCPCFDIQPLDDGTGTAILAAIQELPGLMTFLQKEGGLRRWHCDFHDLPTVKI